MRQEVPLSKSPKHGKPGTSDQSPRPQGYLPAKDGPAIARDAAGENMSDTDKGDVSDASKTRLADQGRQDRIRARAYEIWEREGRQDGMSEYYWHQAITELDQERSTTNSPSDR